MKIAYLRVCSIKKLEDELITNVRKLHPTLETVIIDRLNNPVSFLKCVNIDADVVHATGNSAIILTQFKNFRNFIVTVHDLMPLVYPTHIKDSSRSLFEHILRKISYNFIPKILESEKIDIIVAISKFTKKEILRLTNVSKDKIKVIYWGVDHTRYRPMDKEQCKRMLNLNIKEKHILVVASNLRHKRIDLVKKIVYKLRKCRKDIKLLKAGYGEQLTGEGIINVGYLPESMMPILYNAADVFIHTSEYEGFGLPILEAMACGLPIVASNKASIPEIVGNCGYLIDLDSDECVNYFVEKILDVIESDEINEKGVKRSKKFSWVACAKKYLKIYESLIDG